MAKNWLQYALNRGIRSTSVTNSVFFVAHCSHAYVRHAYQNYCVCLNKAILRISIEPRIESISRLAMHHGTRGLCSMSSSYYCRYILKHMCKGWSGCFCPSIICQQKVFCNKIKCALAMPIDYTSYPMTLLLIRLHMLELNVGESSGQKFGYSYIKLMLAVLHSADSYFLYTYPVCMLHLRPHLKSSESCCSAYSWRLLSTYYVVGCAHEQKAHGLQWVESIGVANKNAMFAILVGLTERFEA